VKRVTGHPKRLRLEAALVPPGVTFVAENHVNVVYPPPNATLEGMEGIVRLVEYLNSGFASRLVSAITGNTQVSKNELENLVPVPLRLVSRD
jgi:adenine-specific DNA-methyltransferase